MDKILVSERRFLGAVAKWAVEQSPYHRPDNLEYVLDRAHDGSHLLFKQGQLGFVEFADAHSLLEFTKRILRNIPQYNAWNERKNGNQAQYKFTSRYDGEGNPDDDFIDLDALERNITNELMADR